MDAIRPHRHARPAVILRLRLKAVKIQAIHAHAKSPVTLNLQRRGVGFPIFAGTARERLGGNHVPSAGVRNGSGFDDTVSRVETKMPELALRHIRDTSEREVAGGIQVVRFQRECQTVAMRQFRQMTNVIFYREFLGRAPQVPQKAFRDFRTRHDAPGNRRHKFQRIVAAPFSKFRAKAGRPVLRTHLPTVKMQHGQAAFAIGVRAGLRQNSLRISCEMFVQRGFRKFIGFKPKPRPGRGPRGLTGNRAAQTHDGPPARRHVPNQLAVGGDFLRQVNRATCINGFICRQ